MSNSLELKIELRDLVDKMSAMHESAESEARGFTPEEREKWDGMVDDQTALEARIANAERIEQLKRTAAEAGEFKRAQDEGMPEERSTDERYKSAYDSYLRRGFTRLSEEERSILSADRRNQIIGDPTLGGFAVNQSFWPQIIKTMTYENGFMGIGHVINTAGGEPMSFPLLDDTANVGASVGEVEDVVTDQFTLGQLIIGAHKYTSRMFKMSYELLQDNNYNLQGEVMTIASSRIARAVRNDMTSGSLSALGIQGGIINEANPSGVTVAANTITYDKLVDLTTALDPAYYPNARFVFNHRTLGVIRKLVDTTGQPIWQPSMIVGEPNLILGYPYELVSSMPDLDTLGNIPILFGDFSYYKIRVAGGMRLRRVDELYAQTDEIGYVGFMRVDAKLTAITSVQSLGVA